MMQNESTQPGASLATTGDVPPGPDDRSALGRIALASVLAGLCPVIPIPFVDDLALRLIRKRYILAELSRGGVKPGRAQMDVYLQTPTRWLGCLTALVIYPAKKIFKKIFFFLTIKDSVDAASQTFHELWLMRHAVRTGQLTQADLTVETHALMPLRRAVEETAGQVDTSPVNQVLRTTFSGSRGLLREAARTLGDTIRRQGGTRAAPEAVEQAVGQVQPGEVGEADQLASRVGEQMWAQRGYLRHVETTFEKNWTRRRNDPG